jgi:hypothetical protein
MMPAHAHKSASRLSELLPTRREKIEMPRHDESPLPLFFPVEGKEWEFEP